MKSILFYYTFKDLEIKEVKKGLMHHVKDMTALQKQMTAMVNIYSFLLQQSNKNSL